MLRGLFGPSSLTYTLRGALEETSATHRGIAERVARASASSTSDFADQLAAATQAAVGEVDIQREMAALADTQLRYEAEAKLLQTAYARLRTAIREHA
jgi:flagellar basal body rod protein FlgB